MTLNWIKHVLQALLLYVFIIVKGAICGAMNIMIAFAYKRLNILLYEKCLLGTQGMRKFALHS